MKTAGKIVLGIASLSAVSMAPVVPVDTPLVYSYQCDPTYTPQTHTDKTSSSTQEIQKEVEGTEYCPADTDHNGVSSVSVFSKRDGSLVRKQISDTLYDKMREKDGYLSNPTDIELISPISAATTDAASIAFSAVSSGSVAGGTASLTFSHTIASSQNLLFVGIENQNVTGLSTVTYNGSAMTVIDSQQDPAVTIGYLYYLTNPSTGANNVSITRSATTFSMFGFASSYTGTAVIGIPDAKTKGNGTAGSETGTLTTIANNSWTVLVTYMDNGGIAAGTGSIARATLGGVSGIFDSNAAVTPPSSKSMTVTAGAGSNYNYVMASFAPDVPVSSNQVVIFN